MPTIRPCALAHDVSQCTLACAPAPTHVRECALAHDVSQCTAQCPRETYLSRFWTIPAHRNPIGRRMAALQVSA